MWRTVVKNRHRIQETDVNTEYRVIKTPAPLSWSRFLAAGISCQSRNNRRKQRDTFCSSWLEKDGRPFIKCINIEFCPTASSSGMFTHILSTIRHICLTGLSVEGITDAFLPSQPRTLRGYNEDGFYCWATGGADNRLVQPHKDLETSPTTHRDLPRGGGGVPIQPKQYLPSPTGLHPRRCGPHIINTS